VRHLHVLEFYTSSLCSRTKPPFRKLSPEADRPLEFQYTGLSITRSIGDVSQTTVRMRSTIPPLLARGFVTVFMLINMVSPVYTAVKLGQDLRTAISKLLSVFLASHTLKVNRTCRDLSDGMSSLESTSEMSVNFYQSTRHNIPENGHVQGKIFS
jgi:hypothetical protein